MVHVLLFDSEGIKEIDIPSDFKDPMQWAEGVHKCYTNYSINFGTVAAKSMGRPHKYTMYSTAFFPADRVLDANPVVPYVRGPMVIMVSYQDKDEAEKNRSGNLDMDTIKSEMVAMWQEWGFHMQAMSTLPLGGLRFKPGRMESVLVKEVVRLIEDKLGMM